MLIIKYFIVLFIVIFLAFPRLSTKTEFNLTKVEYQQYKEKAIKGNSRAIERLYVYYQYSLGDCNKTIKLLKEGVKLGDRFSQYKLSLYLTRDDFPCSQKESFQGEGIYLLEQSAKQGYEKAIIELNKK